MMSPLWTRPQWLYRRLARRAMATIVTNEHFAGIIRSWGGRALVVQDIPAEFPEGDYHREDAFTVAVVNTFAEDEPLGEVLAAARDLEDVTFLVTGDPQRVVAALPENVRFTGFLPDPDYYGLLRSSDAVMCLTTRDHTMQRGACEALSLGKPIITSDWPILSDYFSLGTVHVDNSTRGIRDGVVEMRRGLREYQRGIVELHERQLHQWEEARMALLGLLAGPGDGHEHEGGSTHG
jgi:glycosyltransferase involved in cell wall biosynthesis